MANDLFVTAANIVAAGCLALSSAPAAIMA